MQRLAVLALAGALATAGCGRDDGDAPQAASARRGTPGALPAPAGMPGTSVTGMPTTPPVAIEGEVAPLPEPVIAPEPVADEAPPPAAGTDPSTPVSSSDPTLAAPPAPGGAPPPGEPIADASGASRAVTEYMAALSAGELARAQQLWAAAPSDTAVLDAARSRAFAADVGPASLDPAGRGVATVPVQVRGLAADGTARAITAVYTLQRGTGASWRIVAAAVREGAP